MRAVFGFSTIASQQRCLFFVSALRLFCAVNNKKEISRDNDSNEKKQPRSCVRSENYTATTQHFYSTLKKLDNFFLKNVFYVTYDIADDWLYDAVAVAKYRITVLNLKDSSFWFENMWDLLFKGLPFILRYPTVIFFFFCLYFVFLTVLLLCAYVLFWGPLIYGCKLGVGFIFIVFL